MSDVMQFVRELLEGKPEGIGVRAIVTHVIKVPSGDLTDPAVYLYQIEFGGFPYSDIACTRDPLLQDLKVGDEVISYKPIPESEGYPVFLLLASISAPEPSAEPVAAEVQKEETEVGPSHPIATEEEDLKYSTLLQKRKTKRQPQ